MEVKLIQKKIPVWISAGPIQNHCQFSAETVIPDSLDDVRQIVWTQGGLLLRGKEPGAHAVTVTGEAWASVLYIDETGSLETVIVRKEFEMDFEAEAPDPDALPQLSWYLNSVQARMLNPRKLSVSFEIRASLKSYTRGEIIVSTQVPDPDPAGLHVMQSEQETLALQTVGEKTFTLRQQLPIPSDQNMPSHLEAEQLRFQVEAVEQIGDRCIVKGEVLLRLCGLSDQALPVDTVFHIPFSQLMDCEACTVDDNLVRIEPNSIYLEWAEMSGEERNLDVEIHAVLQMELLSRQTLVIVSDAYSNQMPLSAQEEEQKILCLLERERSLLSAEAQLPIPDDLASLIAVEAKLGTLEQKNGEKILPVLLDLLYRKEDGSLGAARRSIRFSAEEIPDLAAVLDQQIIRVSAAEGNGTIDLRVQAGIVWEREKTHTVPFLAQIILYENKSWDRSDIPDLSLVRRAGESLFDLAREYHSSVELIKACNAEDAQMLLIPAE